MTNQQIRLSPSYGAKKQFCHGRPRLPQLARQQPWRAISAVFVALFLGLTLSGCDIGDTLWGLINTDGKAEAQIFSNENQRVRTFLITTNSFIIETENEGDTSPKAEVQENATVYTMNSNGSVRFETNGQDSLFDLQKDDQIIERPGASGTGTITIIDADDSAAQTQ
jgi:hypothetical protein